MIARQRDEGRGKEYYSLAVAKMSSLMQTFTSPSSRALEMVSISCKSSSLEQANVNTRLPFRKVLVFDLLADNVLLLPKSLQVWHDSRSDEFFIATKGGR